ncbi:hypothetical protein ACLEIY_14035 [Acetobacter tropicalis]
MFPYGTVTPRHHPESGPEAAIFRSVKKRIGVLKSFFREDDVTVLG